MPIIVPSSDLRDNYPELSRICRETGKPVYITVGGKGDTALIDIAVLDELYGRLNLLQKLSAGLADYRNSNTETHEEVFDRFRK